MTTLFYRSAADSWRVGTALDFSSSSKMTIQDQETTFEETVRATDIFIPPASHAALLNMRNDSKFVTSTDLATIQPSPMYCPASCIDCLRVRSANGVHTSLWGSNVLVVCPAVSTYSTTHPPTSKAPTGERSPEPAITLSGESYVALQNTDRLTSYVKHVSSSFRASRRHQCIMMYGHVQNAQFAVALSCAESMMCESITTVVPSAEQRAHLDAIDAAFTVLSPFIQPLHSLEPLAAMRIDLHFKETVLRDRATPLTQFEHVSVHVAGLDLDSFTVEHSPSAPKIFSFLLYGFNVEERERVHIAKRQSNFLCQLAVENTALLSEIRSEYFRFRKALDRLGIDFGFQLSFLSRIAAAVHLLEITTFTDDGEPTNLNAVKAVSRLLQLDMATLAKKLCSRAHCVKLAQLIFVATTRQLLRKINLILNKRVWDTAPISSTQQSIPPPSVSPTSTPVAISILRLPPPPQEVDTDNMKNIIHPSTVMSFAHSLMYEDIFQSLFRHSEAELVHWQQAGFVAPTELSSLFDQFENYELLKVLRGKGGLLSIFCRAIAEQAIQPTANTANQQPFMLPSSDVLRALTDLCKIAQLGAMSLDLRYGVLTVKHTYGTRSYFLATSTDDPSAHQTLFHPAFSELKDYVVSQCASDSQEAFILLDQDLNPREAADYTLTQHVQEMRVLLSPLLQKDPIVPWWIAGLSSRGAVFRGEEIESELVANNLLAVAKLRNFLPRRYVPCDVSFLQATFDRLLPQSFPRKDAELGTPMKRIEAIFDLHNISYLFTSKKKLLLEASDLSRLFDILLAQQITACTHLQTVLRQRQSSVVYQARISTYFHTADRLDRELRFVEEQHKMMVENTEAHRLQRDSLIEQEQRARKALRSDCWVAWIALQTEVEQLLKLVLDAEMSRKLDVEELRIRSSIAQHNKEAMKDLVQRIHGQVMRQSSHLDRVLREKAFILQSSNRRRQRQLEAHKRIMEKKELEEEHNMEVEQSFQERKEEITKKVHERKEQRSNEIREKLWACHERDRIIRAKMEETRTAMNERKKEQIIMDAIERTLVKRVQNEVTERIRRSREEQEALVAQERLEREKKLSATLRNHQQQVASEQRKLERKKELDREKERHLQSKMWLAQERDRVASQRMKDASVSESKDLTRALLNAHSILTSPTLFSQSLQETPRRGGGQRQTSSLIDSTKRTGEASFTMSGGQISYPRLMSPQAIDGLLAYHQQQPTPSTARSAGTSQHLSPSSSSFRSPQHHQKVMVGTQSSGSPRSSASPRSFL